jgi:hypothetical protein
LLPWGRTTSCLVGKDEHLAAQGYCATNFLPVCTRNARSRPTPRNFSSCCVIGAISKTRSASGPAHSGLAASALVQRSMFKVQCFRMSRSNWRYRIVLDLIYQIVNLISAINQGILPRFRNSENVVHRSLGGGELQTVASVPAARKSGGICGRSATRGKSRADAQRDRTCGRPERAAGKYRARRTAPGRSGALRHGWKAQSLPAQASQ